MLESRQLLTAAPGVYQVPGNPGEMVKLTFADEKGESGDGSQLFVYQVDNDQGDLSGVKPSSKDLYVSSVVNGTQVGLFTNHCNNFECYSPQTALGATPQASIDVTWPAGTYFSFYGKTIKAITNELIYWFPDPSLNHSPDAHLECSATTSTGITGHCELEDDVPLNDHNDVKLSFTSAVNSSVLPVVSVSATKPYALEGGTLVDGEFTVSRALPTASSLTVNFAIDGTATEGADYTTLTHSVTIASGQTSATVAVHPLNSTDGPESFEVVGLTISSSGSYNINPLGNNAEVKILDNQQDSFHTLSQTCKDKCECECEYDTYGTAKTDVDEVSGSARIRFDATRPAPGIQEMGLARQGQHTYTGNSNPHVVVRAQDILPSTGTFPDKIKIDLTFNGGSATTFYYSTSAVSPGDAVSYALPIEPNVSSGRYKWSMSVTYYNGGSAITGGPHRTFTGQQDVINRSASEFGKRWWIDGYDQLILQPTDDSSTPDGALWLKGNGDTVWFDKQGSSYVREAGDMDFSTLTLDSSNGRYVVESKYGDRSYFDSTTGKLLVRTDRNGNATAYAYHANIDPDINGKLQTVTDPFGRKWQYDYNGSGMLIKETDYANRETTFTYDATTGTQLIAVTQPDPDSGDGVTTDIEFTYNGTSGHDYIATVKDIDENVTTYTHENDTNRVTSITRPQSGTAELYSPFENRGLASTSSSPPAGNLKTIAGAVGTITDRLGHVTEITTDRLGGILTQKDALGNTTSFRRNVNGQVVRMVEPYVADIGSPVTTYSYFSNGNLDTITYPDSTTESWTYDSTWNRVATHTDQRGKIDKYTYDSATGDLLTARQVIGSDDGGTIVDDLQSTYTYTPGSGSHLEFDGTDDRVDMGDQNDLKIRNHDFSLSMWFNPDTVTGYTLAAGQGNPFNANGEGYDFAYRADTTPAKIQFRIKADAAVPTGGGIAYNTGNLAGSWNHVVVTVENNPCGNLSLYLNGDPTPVAQTPNTQCGDVEGTRGFLIGALPGGTSGWFDGKIDDVRVYHTALTAAQVTAIHTGAVLGTEVGHWNFDEAEGSVANDTGSANKDGTIKSNGVATTTLWRLAGGPPVIPGGMVLSSTDPLNHTVNYDFYDFREAGSSLTDLRRGMIRTITYPDPDAGGSLPAPMTGFTYTYNTSGSNKHLISQNTIDTTTDDTNWTTGTHADRRTTEEQFDVMGRRVLRIEPDPDDTAGSPYTNPSKMYAYKFDTVGNLLQMAETVEGDSTPFTNGNVTEYVYDGENRLTEVIAPDPDGSDPLESSVMAYGYDARGNLSKLIETTTGDSDPFSGTYGDRRTTDYTYDQLNRVSTVTYPDPDGSDPLPGMVDAFVYDAQGNLAYSIQTTATDSQKTNVNNGYADKRITRYLYDALGRQIRVIYPDPDGIPTGFGGMLPAPVTAYDYDAAGNVERMIETNSSDTDPLSATQTSTRHITSYAYDDAGRLSTTTLPDPDVVGSGLPAPIQVAIYDAASNITTSISTTSDDGSPTNPGSAHADKRITTFVYDALDRLTKTTLPDPDGSSGPLPSPVQVSAYNSMGYLIAVTETSSSDPLTGGSYADRRTTEYTVDRIGRIVSESLPDPDGAGSSYGAATLYSYSEIGDLIEITDARDGVTEYEYDFAHRQVKVTSPDPDTSLLSLPAPVTAYVYNDVGDVIYEIETTDDDADPFVADYTAPKRYTTFEYDALHRVVHATQPDPDGAGADYTSPEWTYGYNAHGDQSSTTDPRDYVSKVDYDNLHREIRVIDANPNANTADARWAPIDNSDADFHSHGSGWSTPYTGVVGLNEAANSSSASGEYADWTFDGLEIGKQYEVVVSWNASGASGAQSVPFELYDGSVSADNLTGTTFVDQSQAPDGATLFGAGWQSIGRINATDENRTINVRLNAEKKSTGNALADAVRLIEAAPTTTIEYDVNGNVGAVVDPRLSRTEYAYDNLNRQTVARSPRPNTTSQKLGTSSATYSPSSGTWTNSTPGGDGSSQNLATHGASATATWVFDQNLVIGKQYEVAVAWLKTSASSGAIDSHFKLYDGTTATTAIASPVVDQSKNPAGHDLFGANWQTVGYVTVTNSGLKLSVQLDASSATTGNVIADAVQIVEAAPQTTTTYDSQGNVASVTSLSGAAASYAYDNLNRVTQATLPDPGTVSGQDSKVEQYRYDTRGRLATAVTTSAAGVSLDDQLVHYHYDLADRSVGTSEIGVDGVRGEYYKPTGGSFTSLPDFDTIDVDGVRNDSNINFNTEKFYDAGYSGDFATRWTGAFYVPTSTSYTLKIANVDGDDSRRLVVDGIERIAAGTGTGASSSFTLEAGWHYFEFDYAKHGAGSTGAALKYDTGGGDTTFASTALGYGMRDRLYMTSAGDVYAATDAAGRTTEYAYDYLGRLIQETSPDPDGVGGVSAARITTTYDDIGDVESVEDRLGHETTYVYDNLHRVTEKTEEGPSTTEYEYDEAGTLIKLTDPVGNVTDYIFDGLGRLSEEQVTLGSTKSRKYDYDPNGNLIKKVDRLGKVTTYEYDRLNQQTAERWRDPSDYSIDRNILYTRDRLGNLANVTENDGNSANQLYQYDYVYDQLGQNTAATYDYKGSLSTGIGDISGGTDFVTSMLTTSVFDAFGRRASLAASTKTSGATTADFKNEYQYDRASRMKQVTQDDQSGGASVDEKLTTFSYNDAGQFASIANFKALAGGGGNEVTTATYAYDDAGRLKDLLYSKGGTAQVHYAWSRDAANRVTAFRVGTSTGSPISDALSGNVSNVDYAYDDRDELTGADHSSSLLDEAYTYDDNGNRTNGSYNPDVHNRLTTDGTYNYSYDDEGNLTGRERVTKHNGDDDRWTLAWDQRNRLISVTREKFASGSWSTYDVIRFDYDAFDRRVHKQIDRTGTTVGDQDDFMFYDGTNRVLEYLDYDGAGSIYALARSNVFLWGPATDQIIATEETNFASPGTTGRVAWALTDDLGSVRQLRFRDGSLLTEINYGAFGSFTNIYGQYTPVTFTGQEYDANLKLFNYNARWYDPLTGRFLSEDPLGLGPDENRFRYVGNGPTNRTDPSGLHYEGKPRRNGNVSELPYLSPELARELKKFDDAYPQVVWGMDERRLIDKAREASKRNHTSWFDEFQKLMKDAAEQREYEKHIGEIDSPESFYERHKDLFPKPYTPNIWEKIFIPGGIFDQAVVNGAGPFVGMGPLRPNLADPFEPVPGTPGNIQTMPYRPNGPLVIAEPPPPCYQPNSQTWHIGRGFGQAYETPATGEVPRPTDAFKLHGPFHRFELPARIPGIVDSRELHGNPPGNYFGGYYPTVKAWEGPLPDGATGVTFYTRCPPDGSAPGGQAWWRGHPYDGVHKIPVVITGSRQ
jgi:RHS repeat-associated protein